MTRFTLENYQTSISIWWNDVKSKEIWLSQAWSVFDAIGVSLDDDLDEYRLYAAVLHLEGDLPQSASECQLRRQQPIYLFVRRRDFHFWSFDADGRTSLSTDMCCHLGLPVVLEERFYDTAYTWSNETYKAIRQYQIDRGFDPTTTDFAQSLEYPVYRIVPDDPAQCEEFKEPKEGGDEEDEKEQEEKEDEEEYEEEGEEDEDEDEEGYEDEEEYEKEYEEEGEENEEEEEEKEGDKPPKESKSILANQTTTWTLYLPL
ncbi:hypothetical protein V5O48_016311 [Marasmius crinis-equi]|uniref:Uncharacterized protein n=1 Tax=Marasmius crinis-equi TaxID=585013 RepID=A0ABR3ES45_9AGAR